MLHNPNGVIVFTIWMNNQNKALELHMNNALKGMKVIIKNKSSQRIEVSCTLKESDIILFDEKLLIVKFIIE